MDSSPKARAEAAAPAAASAVGAFTAIIPFYNEADFIGATLASLLAQETPPRTILLVDNASDDASTEVCRAAAAGRSDVRVEIICEPAPGKINALAAATRWIAEHDDAEFVAFCDADTEYPRHYFTLARRLFEAEGAHVAAVMAAGIADEPHAPASVRNRVKTSLVARLLARQCHTGGYGQVFRRDAFLAAGGFSPDVWPYVLLDHEIMQRVLKRGRSVYHVDLWCRTSPRRVDRRDVRWTLGERVLYHLTPFAWKDWFFYRFLGPRFAARGLYSTRLRTRAWESETAPESVGRSD